jgi:hypothetical protein
LDFEKATAESTQLGTAARRIQCQVISELNYPTTGPQHAARKPHNEKNSTNQLSSTPEDQSDQLLL